MMMVTSVIYAKYTCIACGTAEYKIVANGGRWPLRYGRAEDREIMDRHTMWSAHTRLTMELHKMELSSIFKLEEPFNTNIPVTDERDALEREQVIL